MEFEIIKKEKISEKQKRTLDFLNSFEKTKEYFYGNAIDESFEERLYLKEKPSSDHKTYIFKDQNNLNYLEFFLGILQRKIQLCRRGETNLVDKSLDSISIIDRGEYVSLHVKIKTGNRDSSKMQQVILNWRKGHRLYNQEDHFYEGMHIILECFQEKIKI